MLRKRTGEGGKKASWAADNAKIPEYGVNGNDGEVSFGAENRQANKSVNCKPNGRLKSLSSPGKDSKVSTFAHQAILDPELVLAANVSSNQIGDLGNIKRREVLKEKTQQNGLQIDPVTRFDSTSFLDKGIDAIHGVGKLVEGFALTLDNVIGQAFEDWSSQKKSFSTANAKIIHESDGTGIGDTNDFTKPVNRLHNDNKKSQVSPAGWGDFEIEGQCSADVVATDCLDDIKQKKSTDTTIRSSSNLPEISRDSKKSQDALQWQRRAHTLQKELAAMKSSFKEYEQLRGKLEQLQLDLQKTNSEKKSLSEENSMLRKTTLELFGDLSSGNHLDADQMLMRQMESLLEEKARLAQENDRLIRENTGLQELLEYTLRQSGSEYDYDHDEDGREE